MKESEFSAEKLAQSKRITEYYQNLDEDDPANQPTDNETSRPNPLAEAEKKKIAYQEEDDV